MVFGQKASHENQTEMRLVGVRKGPEAEGGRLIFSVANRSARLLEATMTKWTLIA